MICAFPYDYKVQIDFARDPATILCTCSDCGWDGTADMLDEIGDCSLTPGDPSPAGRCPECGSLVYVVRPDPGAQVEKLRSLLADAESFISGFEGDEMQAGGDFDVDEWLDAARNQLEAP